MICPGVKHKVQFNMGNCEFICQQKVTIGLSTYNKNAGNLDSIIQSADEQLYRVRKGDRNKVSVSSNVSI
jgi:PleD family two-component response regulator